MRIQKTLLTISCVLLLSCCGKDKPMESDVTLPLGDEPPSQSREYRYGEGFEELAGADAETVATTALERLCSFTPQNLADGTIIDRINGVVTPALWSQIKKDPDQIVPIVTGRMAGDWELAGGETAVTVSISVEQHPPDTSNSWSRKMSCIREWSGFDQPFWDLYLVTVSKKENTWQLDQLELLSTTSGSQLTTTSTPDP